MKTERIGARRAGQALILAVLLMVFVALLGATFVTVVALNLSRTAREEDKAAARSAAQAGMLWVDAQVTAQGEKWRPERLGPPPAPGDSDYNNYYSPTDTAQGWARTTSHPAPGDANGGDWNGDGKAPGNTGYTDADEVKDDWAKLEAIKNSNGGRVFVKLPDPRGAANSGNAPYLAEVKYLPRADDAGYAPDPGETPDKGGTLRVTIIGLSQNNPNVWERRVRYKGSSRSGAPTAFARFDSNYDLAHSRPVETKITGSGAAGALTVDDVNSLEPGRLVMAFPGGQSATISRVDAATKQIFFTGGAVPAGFATGITIRGVSTLIGGLPAAQMDADGNGTANDATQLPLAAATPAPQPGSAATFINGGALVQGRYAFRAMPSSGSGPADTLSTSGRIVKATNDAVLVDGSQPSAAPVPLPDSQAISALTPSTPAQSLLRLVRDGASQQNGDPTRTRSSVRSLVPPRLDGADSRYLRQTKFADLAGGSTLGYGPGLFINNPGDIEKVAVNGKFRPLENWEMNRLWQRKPFSTQSGEAANYKSAHRLAYFPGDTTFPLAVGSLEERGLRGWVSPWEFLPRGTLIELRGDQIIVTRDDRSEAGGAKPDPAQAWKTADGGAFSDNNGIVTGVYRMALNTLTGRRSFGTSANALSGSTSDVPFNGMIYAAGNVRVRGFLGSKDLTIVSMGNIYVEGSIRRGRHSDGTTSRVALLAKRNVTLNPTQFTARVAGSQDADVAAAVIATASTGTALDVADTVSFRVGDLVSVGSEMAWHTVTAVRKGRIDVAPGAATAGAIRILSDPTLQDGSQLPLAPNGDTNRTPERFYKLASLAEVWARDFQFDGLNKWSDGDTLSTTPLYVALQHAGEMKDAITLRGKAHHVLDVRLDGHNPLRTVISGERRVGSSPFREDTTDQAQEQKFDFDLGGGTSGVTPPTLGTFVLDFKLPSSDGEAGQWNAQLASTDVGNVLARKMAIVDTNKSGVSSTPTSTYGYWCPHMVNPLRVPLSVTVGTFFNPGGALSGGAFTTAASDELVRDSSGNVLTIGSAPQDCTGFGNAALRDEDVATAREDFYWTATSGDTAKRQQVPLRWASRELFAPGQTSAPGGTMRAPSNGDNAFLMRRDAEDVQPAYRIGGLKLERDAWQAASTRGFKPVEISVEAFIYAQDGSWFVIAPPMVEKASATGATAQQSAQAMRYRRVNYAITVTGSLMQNHTPTATTDYDSEPDPEGHTFGAMKTWIDALSYPTQLVPFSSGSSSASTSKASSTGDSADVTSPAAGSSTTASGTNWQTITYNPDPLPVNSDVELPVSPGLNTEG